MINSYIKIAICSITVGNEITRIFVKKELKKVTYKATIKVIYKCDLNANIHNICRSEIYYIESCHDDAGYLNAQSVKPYSPAATINCNARVIFS